MKAVLTLKKDDLLAKLEGRKDEINAHFDEQAAQIQEELDRRDTAANDEATRIANMADWHKAVAEGLTDGSITMTAKGSLRNAPVKPGNKDSNGAYDNRLQYYSEGQLQQQKGYVEDARKQMLHQVASAMDLISLSVEDTVQVDAGDYQALLTSNLRNYF